MVAFKALVGIVAAAAVAGQIFPGDDDDDQRRSRGPNVPQIRPMNGLRMSDLVGQWFQVGASAAARQYTPYGCCGSNQIFGEIPNSMPPQLTLLNSCYRPWSEDPIVRIPGYATQLGRSNATWNVQLDAPVKSAHPEPDIVNYEVFWGDRDDGRYSCIFVGSQRLPEAVFVLCHKPSISDNLYQRYMRRLQRDFGIDTVALQVEKTPACDWGHGVQGRTA